MLKMPLVGTLGSLLRLSARSNFLNRNFCSQPNHYDIIIVGAGMVGTTLACTLGKNQKLTRKKILLLEAGKEPEYTPSETYSHRVVALNPHTFTLFNRIDAWRHIQDVRFSTVKKLQVWDAISDSMITFNNDDFTEPVAYIVENDLVLHAVQKEAKELHNVFFKYNTKIKDLNLLGHERSLSTVELTNNESYTCDLLLGCDGFKSTVREKMGIQYVSWNYDQLGIVATLKLSEPTENVVAWQRFLPNGPIALLPLTQELSSLVWSTSKTEAKTLLSLSEEEFVDAINEAVWKLYQKPSVVTDATNVLDNMLKTLSFASNAVRQLPPSIKSIVGGSRAAFPLGFGHASNYVVPGVALVGDAAHRIHPLTGQGVNLGFGDVDALDRLIGEVIYSGKRLGELSDLKIYESERQRHNVPTMLAADGLHRLYNSDSTLCVLIRSLGLQFTNVLNPVKKTIITQATS